jgi:hypothetical protein
LRISIQKLQRVVLEPEPVLELELGMEPEPVLELELGMEPEPVLELHNLQQVDLLLGQAHRFSALHSFPFALSPSYVFNISSINYQCLPY